MSNWTYWKDAGYNLWLVGNGQTRHGHTFHSFEDANEACRLLNKIDALEAKLLRPEDVTDIVKEWLKAHGGHSVELRTTARINDLSRRLGIDAKGYSDARVSDRSGTPQGCNRPEEYSEERGPRNEGDAPTKPDL